MKTVKNIIAQTPQQVIKANGIDICYQDYGNRSDPVILLIMGLACQMTSWPEALIGDLLSAGFRVIRFDNRDIGLSTEMQMGTKVNMPANFIRFKLGLSIDSPYDLRDMADDAAALLKALGVSQAHVAGVSMGGMIGQIFAVRHPSMIKSLTLIMTSDNSPWNPAPDPKVLWKMNGGGIKGHHLEAARARSLAFWKAVMSPAYPISEEEMITRIDANYHRSYRPAGILRQMRAIMATGSLADIGKDIRVPVNILHGDADLLVRPAAAKRLLKGIPEARLQLIEGMGHDLPTALLPTFASAMVASASRAC